MGLIFVFYFFEKEDCYWRNIEDSVKRHCEDELIEESPPSDVWCSCLALLYCESSESVIIIVDILFQFNRGERRAF